MDARSQRIRELEEAMLQSDFWNDRVKAQAQIRELQDLKNEEDGRSKYDGGGAVLSIFSGAGGDDAEDFSRMLLAMYEAFSAKRGWSTLELFSTKSSAGYRSVTIEITGKQVYGTLKNESGVHRLVRLSPFNAKKLRQTSFSMVEVVPIFDNRVAMDIPADDLKIEFARSGGPGGQNVNKRETAVRIVHLPTKMAVHVDTERSQAQNREKALSLLKAKLYKIREDERLAKESGLYVSKTTTNDWGNQIRSYVLHPYKMVKDHRTNVEVSTPEKVFDGELEPFLEAEAKL